MKENQHGFIALISILIVSSVLLATTLSLAQFGIASRFFVLNLEQKARSQKLAEGCMELMRVKVFNDPNYASNTVTNYSLGGSCSVVSVNAGTIYVSATEKDAVTNLKAVVNTTTGDYVTIEEVASL